MRQIAGAFAEYEKARLVSKLHHARGVASIVMVLNALCNLYGPGGSAWPRPTGMGSSLRSPVWKVSVIKYEQAKETMAMTMTKAATEYTLPVTATSAVQINGDMPPSIAANW